MIKYSSYAVIVALASLCVLSSCERIEDDFTEGNFYPIDPDNTSMVDDTSVVDPPIYDPRDCWSEGLTARHNAVYNRYFTRYEGGWTGGDATYSIPLSPTSNLWLFGDTFLGFVNDDRSRPGTPLINNCLVLQEGEEFTTIHGYEAGVPTAFLKPPELDWWYWPGHGQVYNGNIQLVMFAMKRTNEGGIFSFDYAAIDLYELSFPDFEVIRYERKTLFDGINFGACLLRQNDQTYIYGMEKVGWRKYLHAARISGRDIFSTWEYSAEGNTWSTNRVDSRRLFSDVSDQFTVFNRDEKYFLVTQDHTLGAEIYLYEGDSPVAFNDNQKILYCTPETEGNIFTYNAFVHDQFSNEESLFISYNNNSKVFADLFRNADNYRPYFVEVSGWKE